MSNPAQQLPKKTLQDRVHRELRKGETIYHSTLPCHVSTKFPDGKWIAQVRRDDHGKLVKYPVKGFGTPSEALLYVKGLRPDASGRVYAPQQGEPTVRELYEFVRAQRQKRIGDNTKRAKEIRWRLYIEPEWGDYAISQVTRRKAQEWVTEVEAQIEKGEAGTLGLAQFEHVRSDLYSLFDDAGSFSSAFEDRKNPFHGLDFTKRPPRIKVTIESQVFAPLVVACRHLARERLCTQWIAEVFQVSLLSGLREGEVIALCRDQLDFNNGAIIVDRAMRRHSRAIDYKTRQEFGPVLAQAMNFPKGGTPGNERTRVVPMSDQLAELLQVISARPRLVEGDWDLLWPSREGNLRQHSRFQQAWSTLRHRLHEIATLAPEEDDERWPEVPKHRGWARNSYVDVARSHRHFRLPDIFENIDYRDTRNSFASYMNEVGISQATREHILGHGGGLTNTVYTVITSAAHRDARARLSNGWQQLIGSSPRLTQVADFGPT